MQTKGSLRRSLISRVAILIIALTLLLIYILYDGIGIIRSQAIDSHRQLTATYMERIDNALSKTNAYLSHLAAYNDDLSTLTAYSYGSSSYIISKINIQKELTANTGLYDGVAAFFVYIASNKDLLTSSGGQALIHQAPLQEAIQATSPTEWTIHIDDQSQSIIQVTSLSNGVYLGAYIDSDDWNMTYDGLIFLYGSSGHSLLHKDYNSDYHSLSAQMRAPYKDGGAAELHQSGTAYLMVKSVSKLSKLQLAILIPESELLQSLKVYRQWVWLLPLLVAGIILTFYYFLQNSLLKPVLTLHRSFKNVSTGSWDLSASANGSRPNGNKQYEEFALLFQSFHSMVGQINELKIDVYEEQLRSQQAEYKHLQLQIHPHFYMNTLNIIYNMAALGETKAVQKLTLHLAQYFRFITKTNQELITVAEEMEQVHNYLEIQSMRFPDRFRYELQLPDGCKGASLPPLSILTFVENTMIHGFQDKSNDLFVQVSIEEGEHGQMNIMIRDNGCGFPQDMLEQREGGSSVKGNGIGIYNVATRLKMMAGDQPSEIKLSNDGGAVVQMVVPIQQDNDKRRTSHV
ncbi:sensor histidine kinase [Paenibacillus sp. GCM10023252]|uniref:sensor histidine kinase n=1 Tax=Paenibacillus sp. GCM10023252 TaxID=3252649 RepID=UPI00360FCD4D